MGMTQMANQMTNASVFLTKRPLQLVSLPVCDCYHRPILRSKLNRKAQKCWSQGKSRKQCETWNNLCILTRPYSFNTVNTVNTSPYSRDFTCWCIDGTWLPMDFLTSQQLPSLRARLVWSPGWDRGKQMTTTGFHRFPQVSTSVTWNRWKDMKSTESLMRLSYWVMDIVSCYALLQRSSLRVSWAARNVSSSSFSRPQLSQALFASVSAVSASECLPCHVPKMCPGCLVLVSPSCIMLHLKLALKQHSAEQGALQRREAFAASEWLYILIYSYCVTQRPMLWQSDVKSFHVNWIAQDKPVTPKWD